MASSEETISSHTIKLIDQFSANADKIAAAAARLESATTKAAAHVESTGAAYGKLTKEFASSALALAGWAGVVATTMEALRGFYKVSEEAEWAQIKLDTALKNAGQYSEEATRGIQQYADALINATGQDDEATKQLIAHGAALRLTIAQSEALIPIAIDMSNFVGDAASNFTVLARGADGGTRAIALLAREFGLSIKDGESYVDILKKVKTAVDGMEAKKLETIGGQFRLMWTRIKEGVETVGVPTLKFLMQVQEALDRIYNMDFSSHKKLSLEDSFAAAKKKLEETRDEWLRWQSDRASSGEKGAALKAFEEAADEFLAAKTALDAKNKSLDDLFGKSSKSQVTFYAAVGEQGLGAAKKAMEDAEKAAAELAKNLGEAADDVNTAALKKYRAEQDDLAKQQVDADKAALDEAAALHESEIANGQDLNDVLVMLRQNITDYSKKQAFALKVQDFGLSSDKSAIDTEASDRVTQEAATEAFIARIEEIAAAAENAEPPRDTTEEELKQIDEALSGYVHATSEIITAAMTGGNVKGAVQSAANGMTATLISSVTQKAGEAISKAIANNSSSGASAASSAAAASIFVQIVAALYSLMQVFNREVTSAGGKARKTLWESISKEFQAAGGGDAIMSSVSAYINKMFDVSGSLGGLDASGMGDLYKKWSEEITGGGSNINTGANELYNSFAVLKLSTMDTVSAMADMISATKGVTYYEGLQTASMDALMSGIAMTDAALSDYAYSFGRAKEGVDALSNLKTSLSTASVAYYDYLQSKGLKSDTSSAEFATVKKYYQQVADTLAQQASDKAEGYAALKDALVNNGMSSSDADSLIESQKSSKEVASDSYDVLVEIRDSLQANAGGYYDSDGNFHLGKKTKHSGQFPSYHAGLFPGERYAKVLDTELIARPDQFDRAASYLADRGYRAGATLIVNLSGIVGDQRSVSLAVYDNLLELGILNMLKRIA